MIALWVSIGSRGASGRISDDARRYASVLARSSGRVPDSVAGCNWPSASHERSGYCSISAGKASRTTFSFKPPAIAMPVFAGSSWAYASATNSSRAVVSKRFLCRAMHRTIDNLSRRHTRLSSRSYYFASDAFFVANASREPNNALIITFNTATIGTANSAPGIPASSEPIATASTIAKG